MIELCEKLLLKSILAIFGTLRAFLILFYL